ncbi:Phosphatidylinositol-4-phosphate 5-kinase [Allomyces arbusculus]|nr:Phosphatidylinositol-4-phosphate 5-kinase [Allomyces arbusculus]
MTPPPPPPPPVSTDTMHAAAPVPPPTASVAPSSVPPLKAMAPPTVAPAKLSLITTPMATNGTTPLTESPESIAGSSPTKPIVATTPPSPTAPPTRQRSASDAPAAAASGALRTGSGGGGGGPRSRRGTADGSPGPHPIMAGSSGRSSVVSFGPMANAGLAGSTSVAAAAGPARSLSGAAAAAAGSSPVGAAAAAKVRRHTVTAQDTAGMATATSSSIVAPHAPPGETPFGSNAPPRRSMSRKMSTRFGHRIDQNHEKYAFIFFMLTGIRLSVSRCETKPDRDLLPDDFTAQHKLTSDATGAELDPSQRYDFKFKDYCPMVFRKIRTAFSLRGADYLSSLTGKYILSELFSPGKSGASLFYSHDYRYIIKSIHHAEHKRLLKMLPQYVDYVTKHPNTLLARYYGLHRVKMPSQKPVHFVVMANVFPPHYDMHMTFDLKGSTVGREIPPDELERKGKRAVLKDLNWLNMDRKLMLGPDKAKQFATQLEQDVLFLMDRKIMDYSLLIGIHDLSRNGGGTTASPTTPTATTPPAALAPPAHLQVLEPNRTMTLARNPSTPRAETVRRALHQPEITKIDTVAALHVAANVNADRTRSVFFADHGGFQATDANNQPGPELYFMSVIDILTPYNAAKRVEHAFKAVTQDRHQISAVPPDEYGKRFVRFMTSLVWTPPAGHFAAFNAAAATAAAAAGTSAAPLARPGSPASAPASVPSTPTSGPGAAGTAGSHFVPAVPRDAPIGEEAEAAGSTPEVRSGGARLLADATGSTSDVVTARAIADAPSSTANVGAAQTVADAPASAGPDTLPVADAPPEPCAVDPIEPTATADQAGAGTR